MPRTANQAHPSTPAPVVLVTGAAKRLGREIALALAGAGWRVAVHYRTSADEARQTVADCAGLSGDSAAFRANLGQEAAVRKLLPAVVKRFGQVDAVVNSASTFEHDDAASFSFASLDKHLRSNTGAAIVLAQALHAHLQARGTAKQPARGAVVNLLDQKLWNPNPDFLSYTLSKAALEAANTLLAQALAPTPADVAGAVRFALENQSITGTTLLVDGGQHLMKFERDFSLM